MNGTSTRKRTGVKTIGSDARELLYLRKDWLV